MLKKALTVYDIAKEAKVSPATVSRVLTGKAKVSSEKRERINAIIDKYNFKPNAIARSLINRESQMIGFILPDITNPFFASVFLEAEKYAFSLGYTILLCNSINMFELESFYLRTFVEKKVDGIILMGGRVNKTKTIKEQANEVQAITEQIPIVMVNGRMTGVDCYKVNADEKHGMNQLVDYLYRLGHRKIGFIGGSKDITSSDIKMRVLFSKIKEYGIQCKNDWIINGAFTIESGIETMNKLLDCRELPTAVMAVNDIVAVGALKAAKLRRFKVPDDISITGFDDNYITDIVSPSITTVSQNTVELGRAAVDIIVNTANGRKVKKEYSIKTNMVVKDSCKRILST